MKQEYYKDENGIWRIKEVIENDASNDDSANDGITDVHHHVPVQEEVLINKAAVDKNVSLTPEISADKTKPKKRLRRGLLLAIFGGLAVLTIGNLIGLTPYLIDELQIMLYRVEPIETTALLEDMKIEGSNNIFVDQMNVNNRMTAILQDNILYVGGLRGSVIRFENNFDHSSVFFAEWVEFLHLDEDALYFSNHSGLYRFNHETETRERLLEDIDRPLFIDNVIYFQRFDAGHPALYAYNRDTKELVKLIDNARTTFVDQKNNRLIYFDSLEIHQADLNGNNRETLIRDTAGIWTFIYDGNKLFWSNMDGEVIAYNMATGSEVIIAEFSAHIVRELAIIGDYVVLRASGGSVGDLRLYAVAKTGGEAQLLADRIWDFAIVGNKIILQRNNAPRRGYNIYVMDLNGNIAQIPDERFWIH